MYFASDPDLQDLSGIPVVGTLVESSQPQDVSGYFRFNNWSPLPPGSVQVQSDVETSGAVPETEPGIVGLTTLLALCGIGLVQHLRRQPAG